MWPAPPQDWPVVRHAVCRQAAGCRGAKQVTFFSEIFFVFWSLSLPRFGELHRELYVNSEIASFNLMSLLHFRWLFWYILCLVCSVDPDSMGSVDPYPGPDSQSGSGSNLTKMAQKNIKHMINFIFWSAGCSLLRAEGFSPPLWRPFCNFFINKGKKEMSAVFFAIIDHQNPGSVSGFTWNAGSRSGFNESGSTSLLVSR